MSYSIIECKTDLSGIIHGTNLDKIQGIFPIFNRAARQLLLDVDPKETIRITPAANVFYDKVYDYALPDDLKSNKIIDLRQQVNRQPSDEPRQTYGMQFDQFKNENDLTIQQNNGIKTLRFSKTLSPAPTVISTVDEITGNGTWGVGGNAINLTQDTLNFVSGNSSLRFDISALGTSAYIQNSTLQSIDLSQALNVGSLFVWVYIPSTANVQSINLQWGSSSSNYYTRTVTTQQAGVFIQGWNLCRFDWSGSTINGSPDPSIITYARVTVNYDGTAMDGVRVDNIICQIGTVFNIVYYSKYLFKDFDGNNKEKATADSDTINLDTDSYNLFLKKSAQFAIQQVKGLSADLTLFKNEYDADLKRYKMLYRSEILKPTQTYYHMRNQRQVTRIYPNQ